MTLFLPTLKGEETTVSSGGSLGGYQNLPNRKKSINIILASS